MAKDLVFYKGSRQRRNYWLIPFVILLALITLAVVLFYGMQKYAVITDEGVRVELPGSTSGDSMETASSAAESVQGKLYMVTYPDIIFDAPDYSRVEATAGSRVPELRAAFVEAQDINYDKLMEIQASLIDGNAMMLEMKPRSGQLVWNSQTSIARNYSLNTDTDFANSLYTLIPDLKIREDGKEVYLVAQISCFVDDLLASRASQYALRTEYGANYTDEIGTWLDPYNAEVRNYVIDLARELYDMGFDEVVLADVMHPVVEAKQNANGEMEKATFVYSHEMSTQPNPITAICGFAVYASEELGDEEGRLSIYTDSARSLVRDDEATGQNAVLFMKIYDRVYYRTDKYTYSFNLQDMEGSVPVGKVNDRFVPVVINLIPHDNSSWVYINHESSENTGG
ncbi:MAG: hypothetical protein IKT07_04665 [Oscillospiraceae bacterium]|nr:hypothetical protein [Oscillospiraceae bacterium]